MVNAGAMNPLRLPVLLTLGVLLQGLGGCAAYQKCGTGCPEDAQLDATVTARLAQHRDLAAPNQVYVQSLDRVVYLTGQVATDLQRSEAESIVRDAPGVRRVVNNISISYGGR